MNSIFDDAIDYAYFVDNKYDGKFDLITIKYAYIHGYEAAQARIAELTAALEKMLKEDNGGDLAWQDIARKALGGGES